MKPCCASSLASKLADRDDLTAGGVAVLYGLMVASNKEAVAVISLGRLAQRLRKSRGGVSRIVGRLVELGFLEREPVPGRSTRYTIVFEPCGGCARGPGVARRGTTRGAQGDHVSGIPSGIISLRPAASEPLKGSPRSAETFTPIPEAGVLTNGQRREWLAKIRGGITNAG